MTRLRDRPKSAYDRFLTVGRLGLHYFEWDIGDVPPLVCVHGYTSSAEAFNAPARHWQDRFRIFAPDVRGRGESAWSPAGPYQYAEQIGDLVALVDQLELPRFALVGTSIGGIIAIAYAVDHADRLRVTIPNAFTQRGVLGGDSRSGCMPVSSP